MNVREWALPLYTILMQIAIGVLLMLWIIRHQGNLKLSRDNMNRMVDTPLTIVLLTIVVAMIGAHFHLSKPYLSLLAVLNVRSSWLSREIVFTILFFFSVAGLWYLRRKSSDHVNLETYLGWTAIFFGWATTYCMAQIYILPTQVAWDSPATITYYAGTTLLLGAMAMAALLIMDLRFAEVREPETPNYRIPLIQSSLLWLALLAVIMVLLVTGINFYQITHLQAADEPAITSLNLLLGLYQPLFMIRFGLIFLGVVWLIFSISQMLRKQKTIQELMTPIYGSCLLVMIGEILGRFLFYATHVRLGI
jgi:anaerobic dimethyl sulfoxide reductase subunit C (anchor subunit)